MNWTRRQALALLGATPAALRAVAPETPKGLDIEKGPFEGTRQSLSKYQAPDWFRDAKFGIWSHWGPQSAVEAGDWYARNMYMEGSEQYHYHVQTYGHPSKVGFKDTIPAWKAQDFDPAHLMSLYKKAGAKYFVSMGVHHDNFDLWDSKHQSWNVTKHGPKKDVVGMWKKAAQAEGLRFGVSEHLWIAYKWFSVSHGHDHSGAFAGVPYDGANAANSDLYIDSDEIFTKLDWNESNIPEWWKRHWYLRIKDLLDHYQPDLLYTDGALPFEDYGLSIVAHHYNLSAKRSGGQVQGVYNSKRLEDSADGLCVLDRERGVVDAIWPSPWQTDTCIGEWHYKRGVKYKTSKVVVDLLVDIVSRNGNLLLNFPLPASGQLDVEELNTLTGITKWMDINSEAIYGTRPWKIFGEGPGTASSAQGGDFNENKRKDLTAQDVRFTTKGQTLYAFAMGWPGYRAVFAPLAMNTALGVGKISNAELLGFDGKLDWSQDPAGLSVVVPQQKRLEHAIAFKITGAI